MGFGYGNGPYDKPEAFELRIVGVVDASSGSYEFDYTVVWEHKDGRLFWATDSGCSCPSPFEDIAGIPDLTPITDETFNDFAASLRADFGGEDNWRIGYSVNTLADAEELIGKVIHKLAKR